MKSLFFILLSFTILNSALLAQNIGGIGAMLAIDSADDVRMPVIKNVLPGSPAAASLKEHQFIIKVNDVNCKNKTIEETVGMIRGEAGTHVKLSVADNKQGKHATECDLVRATIQQPAQPPIATADAVTAFTTWCDNQVKQLKKKGSTIVKTFNSDCGNYFFNFNADAGSYSVKVFTLADKGSTTDVKGIENTVSVFDNSDEAAATQLTDSELPQEMNVGVISQVYGTAKFKRVCVGVVGVKMLPSADINKCKAMYIVVYK